jgi:hypothetical protein
MRVVSPQTSQQLPSILLIAFAFRYPECGHVLFGIPAQFPTQERVSPHRRWWLLQTTSIFTLFFSAQLCSIVVFVVCPPPYGAQTAQNGLLGGKRHESIRGNMEISPERAHWLLRSLSNRSSRLHFAGLIAGESAVCDAAIVALEVAHHLLVLELFDAAGQRSWCRSIPLMDASFHLSMMGDLDFAWAEHGFHLVLELRYPDATTLILAERM